MDKKRYIVVKQESNISFLPIVLFEKLARRVPNVAVFLWSVWHDERKRPTTVSIIRYTQMFCRSARSDIKRPSGFFAEKG
ncbi:hypothetical protein AM501_28430 [Aneurinibacillus migulanus]|uniref:hypothetical protein n=1 Tax=Aneurinibacillus migulanus TaxID=47500 RepID=UPI0005BB14ED|nr:hypothetical protein [Aneurinibacillus migulanus]KIV53515.1 hypothetical protein TS64_18965 [Aneurinibacillus migulanus]KPD05021.1 hypothetical protein AM501_28430 [Aneurinibacillus migulanus]MCP1357760.1 hypothetical protein [Aneurinibacillus migulanus]